MVIFQPAMFVYQRVAQHKLIAINPCQMMGMIHIDGFDVGKNEPKIILNPAIKLRSSTRRTFSANYIHAWSHIDAGDDADAH